MKKPTILFILHNYFNRAGTEEHTKTLARHLEEWFDPYILFPANNAIHLERLGDFVDSFPGDSLQSPETSFRSLMTEVSLEKVINKIKPSLVHVQHFFQWPLGLIAHIQSLVGKVIVSFHDYYLLTPDFTFMSYKNGESLISSEYSVRTFNTDLSDYLSRRKELLIEALSKVQARIVPSQYLSSVLQAHTDLSFDVIEHGIEPLKRLEKSESQNIRFGYFGGTVPQKGYKNLIQAFEILYQEHKNISLLMYGPEMEPIGVLPSNIQYLGAFEESQKSEIFGNIDILVIPSEFAETYSLVLSETWSIETPVLAADIGALGERILDNVNGRKFRTGDMQDLYQKMKWFVTSKDWRSWKYPTPRSVDLMVEDYKKLYEKVLN